MSHGTGRGVVKAGRLVAPGACLWRDGPARLEGTGATAGLLVRGKQRVAGAVAAREPAVAASSEEEGSGTPGDADVAPSAGAAQPHHALTAVSDAPAPSREQPTGGTTRRGVTATLRAAAPQQPAASHPSAVGPAVAAVPKIVAPGGPASKITLSARPTSAKRAPQAKATAAATTAAATAGPASPSPGGHAAKTASDATLSPAGRLHGAQADVVNVPATSPAAVAATEVATAKAKQNPSVDKPQQAGHAAATAASAAKAHPGGHPATAGIANKPARQEGATGAASAATHKGASARANGKVKIGPAGSGGGASETLRRGTVALEATLGNGVGTPRPTEAGSHADTAAVLWEGADGTLAGATLLPPDDIEATSSFALVPPAEVDDSVATAVATDLAAAVAGVAKKVRVCRELDAATFKIGKQLGSGSFATVYLARDVETQKQYVVKKLDRVKQTDLHEVENEIAVMQRAGNHPHLVSLKGWFRDEDAILCLVLGYCEGGTLAALLKGRVGEEADATDGSVKQFPEDVVLTWFVQLLMSLDHLHRRHIIHRDLKPENIFMTKNCKVVKLGDLGIAKQLEGTLELAITCLGTPYYMSPEVIASRPYMYASDVWSLGCVLYEMATRKVAFEAVGFPQLMFKILQAAYPPLPPHYSRPFQQLVNLLLRPDPDDRPSTAELLTLPIVRKQLAILGTPAAMKYLMAAAGSTLDPGRHPSAISANATIKRGGMGAPAAARPLSGRPRRRGASAADGNDAVSGGRNRNNQTARTARGAGSGGGADGPRSGPNSGRSVHLVARSRAVCEWETGARYEQRVAQQAEARFKAREYEQRMRREQVRQWRKERDPAYQAKEAELLRLQELLMQQRKRHQAEQDERNWSATGGGANDSFLKSCGLGGTLHRSVSAGGGRSSANGGGGSSRRSSSGHHRISGSSGGQRSSGCGEVSGEEGERHPNSRDAGGDRGTARSASGRKRDSKKSIGVFSAEGNQQAASAAADAMANVDDLDDEMVAAVAAEVARLEAELMEQEEQLMLQLMHQEQGTAPEEARSTSHGALKLLTATSIPPAGRRDSASRQATPSDALDSAGSSFRKTITASPAAAAAATPASRLPPRPFSADPPRPKRPAARPRVPSAAVQRTVLVEPQLMGENGNANAALIGMMGMRSQHPIPLVDWEMASSSSDESVDDDEEEEDEEEDDEEAEEDEGSGEDEESEEAEGAEDDEDEEEDAYSDQFYEDCESGGDDDEEGERSMLFAEADSAGDGGSSSSAADEVADGTGRSRRHDSRLKSSSKAQKRRPVSAATSVKGESRRDKSRPTSSTSASGRHGDGSRPASSSSRQHTEHVTHHQLTDHMSHQPGSTSGTASQQPSSTGGTASRPPSGRSRPASASMPAEPGETAATVVRAGGTPVDGQAGQTALAELEKQLQSAWENSDDAARREILGQVWKITLALRQQAAAAATDDSPASPAQPAGRQQLSRQLFRQGSQSRSTTPRVSSTTTGSAPLQPDLERDGQPSSSSTRRDSRDSTHGAPSRVTQSRSFDGSGDFAGETLARSASGTTVRRTTASHSVPPAAAVLLRSSHSERQLGRSALLWEPGEGRPAACRGSVDPYSDTPDASDDPHPGGTGGMSLTLPVVVTSPHHHHSHQQHHHQLMHVQHVHGAGGVVVVGSPGRGAARRSSEPLLDELRLPGIRVLRHDHPLDGSPLLDGSPHSRVAPHSPARGGPSGAGAPQSPGHRGGTGGGGAGGTASPPSPPRYAASLLGPSSAEPCMHVTWQGHAAAAAAATAHSNSPIQQHQHQQQLEGHASDLDALLGPMLSDDPASLALAGQSMRFSRVSRLLSRHSSSNAGGASPSGELADSAACSSSSVHSPAAVVDPEHIRVSVASSVEPGSGAGAEPEDAAYQMLVKQVGGMKMRKSKAHHPVASQEGSPRVAPPARYPTVSAAEGTGTAGSTGDGTDVASDAAAGGGQYEGSAYTALVKQIAGMKFRRKGAAAGRGDGS